MCTLCTFGSYNAHALLAEGWLGNCHAHRLDHLHVAGMASPFTSILSATLHLSQNQRQICGLWVRIAKSRYSWLGTLPTCTIAIDAHIDAQ